MDNSKEYILCSAIRRKKSRECVRHYYDGVNDIYDIEIGYRHCDIYGRYGEEVENSPHSQGFYTSYGRFVDRIEGAEIAYRSGQIRERKKYLFSEDLY